MKKTILNTLVFLSALCIIHPMMADVCAPCSPPGSGDWTITGNCELTETITFRGNIFIENNAILTIESGVDLNIDLTVNRIEVQDGAKLIIKSGGYILSLLVEDTDGRVGYYLKQVNGPVIKAFNEDVSFYPASTIKVLQHVHAMRLVQAGTANLNTSMLNVCPGTGGNTNCSNNPNSFSTCQNGNPLVETLSTALNRMMVNSDNEDTNAVQEFSGSGNPANGRTAMNTTASSVLGLTSNTALRHKFNCGNVNNNPFNTASLEDLAEIYEEVGEDGNVLGGGFKASFYQLMLNRTNDGFFNNITAIVDQENAEIGLSSLDVQAFKDAILTARKAGNVGCCFSNAGWVQLPLDNGNSSVQYVMSVFFDSFTTNGVNMNAEFGKMLRKPIRDALKTW